MESPPSCWSGLQPTEPGVAWDGRVSFQSLGDWENMAQNILFLAHVDESGTALPRVAYETLGMALDMASQIGGTLTVGLVGENVQDVADSLVATGARILGVSGREFGYPRYDSDGAAVQ